MTNEEIFIRLTMALILGMVIGLERILMKHEAGMRTHGIVSMGSALFIITSVIACQNLHADSQQVLQVLSKIVSGIGFLGAGIIFMSEKEHRKKGLTSAATLWATSGIGGACGLGLIYLASLATFLILFTLIFMSSVEWATVKFFKK